MRAFSVSCSLLALIVLVWGLPASAEAQQAAAGNFRQLAPGVMTTIPPEIREEETFSTHDIVELRAQENLKWTPSFAPESQTLYELAKDVKFRRQAHGLELSFKPLRMMYVDIPQPSGKMQRKLIWYMVYCVRNVGGHLKPVEQADGTYATEKVNTEVRFSPHFVLEAHQLKKAYLDRVIPVAVAAIQQREDPNRPLLNSVQISEKPIPVSTDRVDQGVWGVVTWEDVDPRADFLSVYVQGLSNSYKWIDPPGAYKQGDNLGKGRRFTHKTLQLNFWRPGDEFHQVEDEALFGTAPGRHELYGVEEGLDYAWIYR